MKRKHNDNIMTNTISDTIRIEIIRNINMIDQSIHAVIDTNTTYDSNNMFYLISHPSINNLCSVIDQFELTISVKKLLLFTFIKEMILMLMNCNTRC
jgi:hypothetical protein